MSNLRRTTTIVAASASLLFAAGCGGASEKAGEKLAEEVIESETGGNANVDLDDDGNIKIETDEGTITADGEGGNVEIETDDGSFTSGSGEIPESWPDDVPLPDDLTVTTGSEINDGGGDQVVSISGTTGESAEDVLAFYLDAMTDWEVTQQTTSSANGQSVASGGFSLDERQVTVYATEGAGDEGTTVIINHTTGSSS